MGGESGHGARPFDLAWARSLRDQCKEAGVAYFFKQAGSNPCGYANNSDAAVVRSFDPLKLKDKKGGDVEEFPADLRIREFPGVSR